MPERVRKNCTDNKGFVKSISKYSNYLLSNVNSIVNGFDNVRFLSQEMSVRTTRQKHIKVANTSCKQKFITSFTAIFLMVVCFTAYVSTRIFTCLRERPSFSLAQGCSNVDAI